MKIKKNEVFIYLAIICLCIQFFSQRIKFCTLIDRYMLKHIFSILAIVLNIKTMINVLKKGDNTKGIRRYLLAICGLAFISLLYMLLNGFSSSVFSELYFLLVPIGLATIIVVNKDAIDCKCYIDCFFYILCPLFTVFIFDRITKGVTFTFSFVESKSPFEMEIAHMFLLLFIYYSYIDKKNYKYVSALFCILAWKRMALIFFLAYILFSKIFDKQLDVPKWFKYAVIIVLSLIPTLMGIVLTDSFADFVWKHFEIDLIKFMQFRFQSLTTAFLTCKNSQGLGSFITVDVPWYNGYVHMNMHCDIVRLYLEVSIFGLVIFLVGISCLAEKIHSYFVLLFMLIELVVSHMLGNGGLPFWTLAFILILSFNSPERDLKINDDSGKKMVKYE